MNAGNRRERWMAAAILCGALLVVCWQLAAWHAKRGFDPMRLSPEDFDAFRPDFAGWEVRQVYAKRTATEPTIVAYELRPGRDLAPEGGWRILVRLVHGYNMVDCMRIKYYDVELLDQNLDRWPDTEVVMPYQLWRLTHKKRADQVWMSSMLEADGFEGTHVDTRDMAFPRVGTPDDPAYRPTGLSWRSLRHPWRNFRRFIRGQWNASRTDLLTFLRLRRPAWASDVMVTMVSEFRMSGDLAIPEGDQVELLFRGHGLFYEALQREGADQLITVSRSVSRGAPAAMALP